MFSKTALRYVVSLGLLGFFAFQMDWSTLLQDTRHINPALFLGAVVLVMGQVLFLNLRWHAYLNAGRVKIPFRVSTLINIAGYFANIIFIASIGGIIAKSGLAIRQGVPVVHAVFATFLDRFMTLFALIVLGACSLPFLQETIDLAIFRMFALTIGVVFLAVVFAFVLLRSGLLKGFILSSRRRARFMVTLRNFTQNYRLMRDTALYSIVAQILFILSVYVLSLGFDDGAQAGVVRFLALMPVLALISSLPLSFGGWGIREGAFIYGLGLIGFSMESAFLLSVQVGLVGMIAPLVVGAPCLFRDKPGAILNPDRVGASVRKT